MRVWVADDDAEVVGDICDCQVEISKNVPKIDDVEVIGIDSLKKLKKAVKAAVVDRATLPEMIFLDLRFHHRDDGLSALKFLKYHSDYDVRNIPVVMFSQSNSPVDVFVTIHFRANAYITKDDLIERFWSTISQWRSTKLAKRLEEISGMNDDLTEPERIAV